MSSAVSLIRTPARGAWPTMARACLLGVIVAAATVGALAAGADARAQAVTEAGADLTRLLRAMAGIKALMAGAAAGAVFWRLGAPATAGWFAAYALACGAMAAGPGLIWSMAHVAAGAALLHAGLLASIVLLWRDPLVGLRLADLVRARRGRA